MQRSVVVLCLHPSPQQAISLWQQGLQAAKAPRHASSWLMHLAWQQGQQAAAAQAPELQGRVARAWPPCKLASEQGGSAPCPPASRGNPQPLQAATKATTQQPAAAQTTHQVPPSAPEPWAALLHPSPPEPLGTKGPLAASPLPATANRRKAASAPFTPAPLPSRQHCHPTLLPWLRHSRQPNPPRPCRCLLALYDAP